MFTSQHLVELVENKKIVWKYHANKQNTVMQQHTFLKAIVYS